MDDPTLLPLLEKYIEGTLDDAGRAELEKKIVASVDARTMFWEYLEQHAFIGELSGEARGRALARLEKPPTRRAPVPRPSRPSSGTLPFLIAAGLLIGFVGILIASMSGTDVDEARSLATFRAKQAERRKAIEARIRAIEAERQRLLSSQPAPEGKVEPQKEEERKKALEDLTERRRKVDEELRQTIEQDKPTVVVQKAPEPPPTPLLVPEKTPTTVAALPTVATIAKLDGAVLVDQKPAAMGQELAAGQRMDTSAGTVEIVYPDATRVEFGPGTVVRDFKAEGGKRFWMETGSMIAVVSKQPKGQPMVIESKHGEATVVGTTLRVRIEPEAAKGMRLDVEEGTVQLKNRLTGRTVTVESGHYAVAAGTAEVKSLALPIDEVLLTASQGKITGGEWRLIKSAEGAAGVSLESVPLWRKTCDVTTLASFVTVTFEADANRDYFVWVRGACLGGGATRDYQDGLMLKFARAQTTQPKLAAEWGTFVGTDGVGLAGWGRVPGTRWIAGDGDFFDATGSRTDTASAGRAGDEKAATVRFARPGSQTLRLYLLEGPMRVDAIWLSTTQKTRPDAGQVGPVK